MSALSPSATPYDALGCLSVSDNLSTLGNSRRISLPVRHHDLQQEIDRHAERVSNLLMQRNGSFALSCFEVRQVALGDTDAYHQLGLCHIAPLPHDADGIFAGRQPIDNGLGQHNLTAGCERLARAPHDPGSARILTGCQRNKSFVIGLRKNGKFLPTRELNELNLSHHGLSIVNLATMPDGGNDDGVALDVKDDAPVAGTQPRTSASLETLHVALSGPRERQQLCIQPPTLISRKVQPLPRGGGGKGDLHGQDITYCDIYVKCEIAICDYRRGVQR